MDNLDGAIPAMKRHHLLVAGWLLTMGCGAASTSNSPGPGARGGSKGSGSQDASALRDAGAALSGDARAREVLAANLSEDVPTFNWQAPGSGTGGSTGAASGGATTAPSSSGRAGSSAASSSNVGSTASGGTKGGSTGPSGGATAAGGARGGSTSAGGAASYTSAPGGGATGAGGRTTGGGSSGSGSYDASVPADSAGTKADGSAPDAVVSDTSARETGVDLRAPDTSPAGAPDAGPIPDTGNPLPCSARIRALVPISLDRLVSGANSQVVLRAEILSGGPASTWSWRAWFGSTPLSPTLGREDMAAAAFRLANPGSYTFSVTDGSGACSASVTANAFLANACPECDRSAIVRAAPSPSTNIPVQTGAVMLLGASPFAQNNIILARGVSVSVAPSVGSNVVVSYVRILNTLGTVVADGLADQRSAFTSRLLAVNSSGDVSRYNILVVPVDGSDGGTINATAPQLFPQLTPAAVNTTAFRLMDGVMVTGQATAWDGSAVADARVVLGNRDPKDKGPSSDLLFSSVGRSNAQGSYQLQAQTGNYWVTATPPADSGLTEAVSASSLPVSAGLKLDMQWDAPSTMALTLNVADAQGNPLAGAQVTLSTAQARKVGTIRVTGLSVDANGSVRSEGTTSSAGSVTFDRIPSNTTYQVIIQPQPEGPFASTTTTTVVVASTATTRSIAARAAAQLSGVLIPASTLPLDWSQVTIAAYDKSDDATDAPRFANASADGHFSLSVTPDRPYVLLAIPPLDSGYARTFVGLGPLTATEFPISQTLPLSMDWQAQVLDETQNGVGSTAMQVFCGATWPACIDPNIPLAETTSEADGTFRLPLPDPSTR